jgi:hypothetical protein
MTITDRTGGLRHWTPRVAPAITTTTFLTAARVWHENGGHSIGTVWLMGAFATSCGMAGMSSAGGINGDPVITSVGFGGAAAFAMGGAAAYYDSLPLAVMLWLIATIAAYAVCAKYWRQDMRAELDHLRALERDREKYRHVERVELTRSRSARDVAELTSDAARAHQMLEEAKRHRQMLNDHPELAGFGIAAEILLGEKNKEQAER